MTTICLGTEWTMSALCVTRDTKIGREVCLDLQRDDGESLVAFHMYLRPSDVENLRRLLAEANAIALEGEADL